MSIKLRSTFAALVVAVCALWQPAPLRAGGGPESYLLVVNSASPSSLAIANYYIALRQIPSSNVLYIEWKGDLHMIDVETFRQRILQPILEKLTETELTSHIDGIVYSSDFPYKIDFTSDVPEKDRPKLGQAMTPVGSLNSLTYYYQLVLQKQPLYVNVQLATNNYFRPVVNDKQIAATHGFRGWYGWGRAGELLESGGNRFFLSMMLGLTTPKGNTSAEVIRYLQRSAKADGSAPAGTIYFTKTNDPRSVPRHPWFDSAAAELKALGVAAEVLTADVPIDKNDIAGGMLGHANVLWSQRNNTILPGAMVDDLTSYGADVQNNAAGQTLLTEFLRAGAAGSCGTAVEPLANPVKFPIPFLFVHYARGCTLAESFYQSVAAPYQLVMVGDPLCRPWAKVPKIEVAGVKEGDSLKGAVSIQPTGGGGAAEVDRFDLYLDGGRLARCGKGGQLEFDTTKYPDGWHELRVVGTESGPIETQGRLILPVMFDNHGQTMKLTVAARAVVGQKIKLNADAPGATGVTFFTNGKVLGNVNGGSANITVDTNGLGAGPVTIRAIGWGEGGSAAVLAAPVTVQIDTAR